MLETGDDETADRGFQPPTRRNWRPAVVLWSLAPAACFLTRFVDVRTITPDLLIGSVDANGFQYLGFLASAILVAAAAFATVFWVGGLAPPGWRSTLTALLSLGLSLALNRPDVSGEPGQAPVGAPGGERHTQRLHTA